MKKLLAGLLVGSMVLTSVPVSAYWESDDRYYYELEDDGVDKSGDKGTYVYDLTSTSARLDWSERDLAGRIARSMADLDITDYQLLECVVEVNGKDIKLDADATSYTVTDLEPGISYTADICLYYSYGIDDTDEWDRQREYTTCDFTTLGEGQGSVVGGEDHTGRSASDGGEEAATEDIWQKEPATEKWTTTEDAGEEEPATEKRTTTEDVEKEISTTETAEYTPSTEVVSTENGDAKYKESWLTYGENGTYGDTSNGGDNGLYVSDVKATTAVVDWSKARFDEMVPYTLYTPKCYRLELDNNVSFDLPLTQTSCTVTGLDAGMYNYVYLYYIYEIQSAGEMAEESVFLGCHFTTPGKYVEHDASVDGAAPAQTTTGQPTTQQPVRQTYVPVVLSTPHVKKVVMEDTTVSIISGGFDSYAEGAEYRILDKSGKVLRTYESTLTIVSLYNIKANGIYAVQVRSYAWDSTYNKVYSDWSGKEYVIAQPKISASKKKYKIKKNSVTIQWGKINGASSYVVYARKRNAKKWVKVATTKKTKFTLKKIKGKKVNTDSNNYEITVVAKGKYAGKKLTSSNYLYFYTYKSYK